MDVFPTFMKNPINMVDPSSQYTTGIEGYVFDGIDGSQMAFWTYEKDALSKEHEHSFEEYILVVQGHYKICINNEQISLNAGDEFVIPKGTMHSGQASAGTRAIYAFGGKRAERKGMK